MTGSGSEIPRRESTESVEDTLLAHPLGWQERRKKMKKWVESLALCKLKTRLFACLITITRAAWRNM
eukprot:736341-Hanusia_phi.AAC.3